MVAAVPHRWFGGEVIVEVAGTPLPLFAPDSVDAPLIARQVIITADEANADDIRILPAEFREHPDRGTGLHRGLPLLNPGWAVKFLARGGATVDLTDLLIDAEVAADKIRWMAERLWVDPDRPIGNPWESPGIDVDYIRRAALAISGSKGLQVRKPTAADEEVFFHTVQPITVTRIYGITDAGTVTFKIEWRPESDPFSSGTQVHATGLVADTTGEEQVSGFADATIPAGSYLAYVSSAVTATPGYLVLHVEYTVPVLTTVD